MKRLISRYYHALAIGGSRVGELGTDFDNYQEILTKFKRNATAYFDPMMANVSPTDGIQKIVDEILVIFYFSKKNIFYVFLS